MKYKVLSAIKEDGMAIFVLANLDNYDGHPEHYFLHSTTDVRVEGDVSLSGPAANALCSSDFESTD